MVGTVPSVTVRQFSTLNGNGNRFFSVQTLYSVVFVSSNLFSCAGLAWFCLTQYVGSVRQGFAFPFAFYRATC